MRNVNGKLTLEIPVTSTPAGKVHFPTGALRKALPEISLCIGVGQTEGLVTLKDALEIHWRFDPT
jgi:hypothetical protein